MKNDKNLLLDSAPLVLHNIYSQLPTIKDKINFSQVNKKIYERFKEKNQINYDLIEDNKKIIKSYCEERKNHITHENFSYLLTKIFATDEKVFSETDLFELAIINHARNLTPAGLWYTFKPESELASFNEEEIPHGVIFIKFVNEHGVLLQYSLIKDKSINRLITDKIYHTELPNALHLSTLSQLEPIQKEILNIIALRNHAEPEYGKHLRGDLNIVNQVHFYIRGKKDLILRFSALDEAALIDLAAVYQKAYGLKTNWFKAKDNSLILCFDVLEFCTKCLPYLTKSPLKRLTSEESYSQTHLHYDSQWKPKLKELVSKELLHTKKIPAAKLDNKKFDLKNNKESPERILYKQIDEKTTNRLALFAPKQSWTSLAKQSEKESKEFLYSALPLFTKAGIDLLTAPRGYLDMNILGLPVAIGGFFIDAIKLPFCLVGAAEKAAKAGFSGFVSLLFEKTPQEEQTAVIFKSFILRMRETMTLLVALDLEEPDALNHKFETGDLKEIIGLTFLHCAYASRDYEFLLLVSGEKLRRKECPEEALPLFDKIMELKKNIRKALKLCGIITHSAKERDYEESKIVCQWIKLIKIGGRLTLEQRPNASQEELCLVNKIIEDVSDLQHIGAHAFNNDFSVLATYK